MQQPTQANGLTGVFLSYAGVMNQLSALAAWVQVDLTETCYHPEKNKKHHLMSVFALYEVKLSTHHVFL